MSNSKTVEIGKGQLFSTIVTIILLIVTSWFTTIQRIKALEVGTEIRLCQLEEDSKQNNDHYLQILENIGEIMVVLEGKENRDD